MRLHRTVDSMADSVDSMSVTSMSSHTKKKSRKLQSAYHDVEHDVWVCKFCGWLYSTSRPNSRERREHKKLCAERPQRQEEELGTRPGCSDGSCVTADHDLADSGATPDRRPLPGDQWPERTGTEMPEHRAGPENSTAADADKRRSGQGRAISEKEVPSGELESAEPQIERSGAKADAVDARHSDGKSNGLPNEAERIKSPRVSEDGGGDGLHLLLHRDGDEGARRRSSGAETDEFFDPCGEVEHDDDAEAGRSSVSEDMRLLSEDGLLEEMSQAASAEGDAGHLRRRGAKRAAADDGSSSSSSSSSSIVGKALRTSVSPGCLYHHQEDQEDDLTWLERCFGFLMPLVAKRRAP